ncbi:major facilitator superfamily permease [Klebsiella grimontii]|uniref:Major facilitator superfamily permease n=1 Tax=Klebsiella grimontii TaxID=2058152 RepID=A0A7H4NUP7_9ENTR|nr:major facilitator superfamily permease [Klebsiella grimontii]
MNITSNSTTKDIPRQRLVKNHSAYTDHLYYFLYGPGQYCLAMPGGMDADLGISATMAGLAGGIFFIGYLFLQVPGGKIAVHVAVRNLSAGRWSPGRSSPC